MTNFNPQMVFGKESSPFTEEEWRKIEGVVVEVAKRTFTARHFLEIVGPTGFGYQTTWIDNIVSHEACISVERHSCEAEKSKERKYVPIPLLHKDFIILWRDVEASRQLGVPLELSTGVSASRQLAFAEDKLIFYGKKELGIDGILTVDGSLQRRMKNWNTVGNAFADITSAVSELAKEGFTSEIYTVLSPADWVKLQRVFGNTGVLEIEQIKKVVKEVIVSPVLDEGTAIVLSSTADVIDLFVAHDVSLAFVETQSMDIIMRVMEAVVPRIKNPRAICIIRK